MIFGNVVQCHYVSTCQVCNVDIIADTSAVAGVVVSAEDFKLALSEGCFHNTRKKIFRLLLKACDYALWIITSRIEVAQSSKFEATDFVVPLHKTLDFKLGKSVIIDWILRMIFVHWKILWFAKCSSTRRKNHDFAVVFYSCIHDVECACDIID